MAKQDGRQFGRQQVIERLDQNLLSTLTPEQAAMLDEAIKVSLPRNTPKLVDLRFTMPMVHGGLFFVIQVGRDRGRRPLAHMGTGALHIANFLISGLFLGGLLYAGLFFLYMVESFFNLNFLPHWEWLE
jgi:hypothetical protein